MGSKEFFLQKWKVYLTFLREDVILMESKLYILQKGGEA